MMGNDNARGNAGRLAIGLIALGAWIGSSTAGAQEGWQRSPTRLESRNERFEQAARENTPPEEAVLFVGSATIAGWDLDRWFPEYETIKRGIGGTMISESTYFAERVIIPHKPSTIVLYSGDNDVWLGKTPAMVADDFEEFVDKVRTPLPNVQIIFISIRPSIARWDVVEKFREANALIEKIIEGDEHLYYADIATAMIGGDGKPRRELLTDDDLHLTEAGFALWTSIVKPVIKGAEGNYRKLKMASIEAAALSATDRFIQSFNSRNPRSFAASLHYPHVRPSAGRRSVVTETAEEYAAGIDFDRTVATGWDHSEWDWKRVIHLGENKAHVAGQYTRHTKDGEKILTNRVTYIVTKIDGDWGIQARFAAGRASLSEEQEREYEAAALKTVEAFMTAFNARDEEAWAGTLNYPHVRVASGTVTTWETAKEYTDGFDFDDFAERFGWDHSQWDSMRAVQVAAGGVNVALEFSRFDADGNKLSTFQTLYLVTQQDGHWGIRARSSFAP